MVVVCIGVRRREVVPNAPFDELATTIKHTAFKVTRSGELVGREAARRLGVPFGIVDLSLAPTPAVGDSVADILKPGMHGSTFGGNPVCCAGALSVINRLDDEFLAEVQKKSDYIFSTLSGCKGIKSVTGMGLMIGIETEKNAKDVVMACMEKGVLCLTAKDKVRLLPALNIPMDDLEYAIETIKAVAAELGGKA